MPNENVKSYTSCEKCGSEKAEDYHVRVAGELVGDGLRVRLCPDCAGKLDTEVYGFVREGVKIK